MNTALHIWRKIPADNIRIHSCPGYLLSDFINNQKIAMIQKKAGLHFFCYFQIFWFLLPNFFRR